MLEVESRSVFALLTDKESIWVVNNTKESVGQSCLVALDFGRGIKFPPIPPGPDPICLTEQVPHKSLEESFDFRQAVSKELLKVVTEKSAKAYYKKNEGRQAAIKKKLDELMKPTTGAEGKQLDGTSAVAAQAVDSRDLLHPKILSLHTAFKEQNIGEREVLEELISMQDDLTEHDLEFIQGLNSLPIKRFARETAEARRAEMLKTVTEEVKPKEEKPKETEPSKRVLTKEASDGESDEDFPLDD